MTNKKGFSLLLCLFLLYSGINLSAEKEESFWQNFKELTDQLKIVKSQFLRTLEALEKDINKADSANKEEENDQVDIQDKIDTIRLKIEEVVDLKKSENEASSWTLIALSLIHI